MDLPVLNQLEKIYPTQDSGAQAISKLVRNQNIIVQGIEDAQLIEGPQGPEGPQGEQGSPGNSPYIGENGNWWIGEVDTGISANAAISIQELQEQINVLNVIEELDLLNGWKHTDDTTKIKISRVGNTVTITDFLVSGVKTDPTIIFQLPPGLRPMNAFDVGFECYTSTPWAPSKMFFSFTTSGSVSVRGTTTDTYVRFVCTFVCDWEG